MLYCSDIVSLGRVDGTTSKLRPLTKRVSHASIRGMLDMFLIHLALAFAGAGEGEVKVASAAVAVVAVMTTSLELSDNDVVEFEQPL